MAEPKQPVWFSFALPSLTLFTLLGNFNLHFHFILLAMVSLEIIATPLLFMPSLKKPKPLKDI